MKVYFLRHGIAEDVSPSGLDADRRLTREGIEEMERIARGLKRIGLKVDLVLTSPLPRAKETAEIVARALDAENRLEEENALAPGFGLGDLQRIVEERSGIDRLMLVGHNFDLPNVAGQLVGGAAIDLK